ncbi:hypothetical protein [Cupriavidus pinatubonensis]|uniref:hypothetical protein n=1 Tax=Cupriavidus pinatubonensis TaxID=248026 RepID=UPI0036242738
MKRYIWNLLIAIDQFGNAVAGGDPDETISSRAGKAMREGKRWGCLLCRLLNWFERDHCAKSIEPDEGDRAVVPD